MPLQLQVPASLYAQLPTPLPSLCSAPISCPLPTPLSPFTDPATSVSHSQSRKPHLFSQPPPFYSHSAPFCPQPDLSAFSQTFSAPKQILSFLGQLSYSQSAHSTLSHLSSTLRRLSTLNQRFLSASSSTLKSALPLSVNSSSAPCHLFSALHQLLYHFLSALFCYSPAPSCSFPLFPSSFLLSVSSSFSPSQ